MHRIRQRRTGSYPLTATVYDTDGTAQTVTGTPTVSIYDPTDTLVVTNATATLSSGVLTYSASVDDIENLGVHEAIWSDGTNEWVTRFEIVGGVYFEIYELRAYADELESTTAYTTAALEEIRTQAEDDFEALANRAFVARGAVADTRGQDEYLFLPFRDIRSVISITDEDGAAVAISDIEVLDTKLGAIKYASDFDDEMYSVYYTHGKNQPPAAVKRAVMLLAKVYAIPNAIDPRATAVLNADFGGYRLSVAGKDGKTGIPDVDAAAARYGDNTPVVG